MYYVESESTGEELSKGYVSLEEAVDEAKRLLEDDPEQGELQVIHYTVERIVRFGPDANWDTQVMVLRPGERLSAPTPIRLDHLAQASRPFECSPEDIDESGGLEDRRVVAIREDGSYRYEPDCDPEPYDISDPKHPEFHSVHADIWDSRAGK